MEKDSMRLEKNIKLILDTLQRNGQGYIVGGYVRDRLLGLEPKDCDFVTDIEYGRLLEIFKSYSPKEIGKHFGIIQIKIDGTYYEIAKMREDIGVPQDRKEQKIEFTKDIYEDLKRRDFTINAIAYDGEKFFYGDRDSLKDIESKTLRFVGECRKRIEEDPLRILRYFRFLATKDLKYLAGDIEKISNYSKLIKTLSIERIRDEFNKILLGKNCSDILKLIFDKKILEIIIPEYKEIEKTTLKILKEVEQDLILRLIIFFADIKDTKKIMNNLRYAKNSIERVVNIIEFHRSCIENNEKKFLKKMLGKIGEEDMQRYLQFLKAEVKVTRKISDFEKIKRLENEFQDIIARKLPISMRDLNITGKELLENGVEKGKLIGEILNYLLNQVLETPECNTKEKLLELAFDYCKNIKNNLT